MIASNKILWLPEDGVAETRHIPWDTEGTSAARNPAGVRIDPDTALKSTVVLACSRVLAESMASLPLHVYRYLPAGGKEIAREHPLYRRLRIAPNSWQTSFEWLEQQVLWLALWGNSYNLLVPGSAGFATEIQPLHPSRMTPERIENGRIRYKYRTEKGSEETYTQDQVMHIRWLSDDGLKGMIPVELARDAIALARACEIHGGRYFGNGARPGFVLSTDNDMKPEAARELRDNWERMHRGPDRSNRTAVLFGGLKPIELGGANMQESQFLETRRFQIEEICRLYRVPPHLVGDLTRSSFSNIEQQSLDFLQHTLLPWCRRFENAFSRDLIVEDDQYFAEFDTRGMLRGDAAARASYYQTMWNLGVASINEIRGWENLNPVDGGDTRFVQLNMQTLSNAVSPPPAEQPAQPADPQPEAQPTAEVAGVIAIVEQIKSGAVTPEAALAIISSVYPAMPPDTAAKIVAGATPKPEQTPVAEPQPKETPAAVSEQPAIPAGRSLQEGDTRGFCPTGKGGGIDNSCSSKGGGSGPDLAVGDVVKRRDVAVGQTISVQKYGQQAVHNGTVIKVKHDDKSSEITLKDSDGKEKSIKIRDLAQIREANLGDSGQIAKPKEKAPKEGGGSKRKPEGPPEPPQGNSKKQREAYKKEVQDYCQKMGVEVKESFFVRGGSTIDSLHEVAVGIHRLSKEGQELPSRVVLTTQTPQGKSMGRALGYFAGGDTVYIHAKMPGGEPEYSVKSGWVAGSAASPRGTVLIHETGHMAHAKAIGQDRFNALPRPPRNGGTSLDYKSHQVAGQVSRYAQTCPVEFVAETYSGHMAGRRYSDDVYQQYNAYGGPRLPGVKVPKRGRRS